MSTPTDDTTVQALQAVLDRVISWQDGATTETVRQELAEAVRKAGLQAPDDVLDRLAERIHADADHADAAELARQLSGPVEPA